VAEKWHRNKVISHILSFNFFQDGRSSESDGASAANEPEGDG
jgi:hypothetical protein